MPTVHPVATATPPHRYRQSELRDAADLLLPESPGKAQLLAMFDNARIDARAFAVPLEWLVAPHGFKDRMAQFASTGLDLAEAAARGALANAGLKPADIDAVLLVCTTGIATPSLDARLSNRLGLRSDVARIPVWGLGCAGGVAGLARAAELAISKPGANVLVVALELCTVAFDVASTVAAGPGATGGKKSAAAASLFADGCAAVVVSGDTSRAAGPLRFVGATSHLFPDTERVMGWDVEDHTLDVVLSPRIPQIVEESMAGVVHPFADLHLAGGRPSRWVLHPGGAKVVEAYRTALGLAADALGHTESVLRRHGNMSSPTVLFVLDDAMAAKPKAGETLLLGALGPGFAAELALLEVR